MLGALNISDALVYSLVRDDVVAWVYGGHSLGVMMERTVLGCVYRCEALYPGADSDSFPKVVCYYHSRVFTKDWELLTPACGRM